jgi:hypothetical protein
MMMDKKMTSPTSAKGYRTPMVVVAALAGAGLGIGGVSLLGAPSDPVALQSAALPSAAERSGTAGDATGPVDVVSNVGSEAAKTGPEPPAGPATSDAGGVVDRAAAEQAALAYLGEGRVTWVSQEDDYGAAWEIEVTLPNGREVDVYVDAAGQVVHTS